jgi:hypothetical protein
MQRLKHLITAVAVVGASVVATTNFASAQDYVLPGCVPPAPSRMQLYYSYLRPDVGPANWEPFFRHHYYRYGPIVACAAIENGPVVSAKY